VWYSLEGFSKMGYGAGFSLEPEGQDSVWQMDVALGLLCRVGFSLPMTSSALLSVV
jgi:hypothetical protein